MPQFLPSYGVQRIHIPLRCSAKYEIAGSREDACPGRIQDAVLPLDFTGLGNDGAQMSPAFVAPETRSASTSTAEVHLAGPIFRALALEEPPALFADVDI